MTKKLNTMLAGIDDDMGSLLEKLHKAVNSNKDNYKIVEIKPRGNALNVFENFMANKGVNIFDVHFDQDGTESLALIFEGKNLSQMKIGGRTDPVEVKAGPTTQKFKMLGIMAEPSAAKDLSNDFFQIIKKYY